MATKLYHYRIGFPENLILPTGTFLFNYSRHARCEFSQDRYYRPNFTLPHLCFALAQDMVVEVELQDGQHKPSKIVYRMPFEQTQDLDLSLCILWQEKLIKTLWFNDLADEHTTLDKSKYSYP